MDALAGRFALAGDLIARGTGGRGIILALPDGGDSSPNSTRPKPNNRFREVAQESSTKNLIIVALGRPAQRALRGLREAIGWGDGELGAVFKAYENGKYYNVN